MENEEDFVAIQCQLVRLRLIAYMHARGDGKKKLSAQAFANELNSWEGIYHWYNQSSQATKTRRFSANDNISEENRNDVGEWIKVRSIETFRDGQTKPEKPKFGAICEYLIFKNFISRAELNDIQNRAMPAHIISAEYAAPSTVVNPKNGLAGEFHQYVFYKNKAVFHQLFIEATTDRNAYSVHQIITELNAHEGENLREFEKRMIMYAKSIKQKVSVKKYSFCYTGFAVMLTDFSFLLLRPLREPFMAAGMFSMHDIVFEDNKTVEFSASWTTRNTKQKTIENIQYVENNSTFLTYSSKNDTLSYVKRELGGASSFYSIDGGEFYRTEIKPKEKMNDTVSSINDDLIAIAANRLPPHERDEKITALVNQGADINYQDSLYGYSVLHLAASYNSLDMIEFISQFSNIDFLLQTKNGKLPSSLAFDADVAEFLIEREHQQARAMGINYIEIAGNTGELHLAPEM